MNTINGIRPNSRMTGTRGTPVAMLLGFFGILFIGYVIFQAQDVFFAPRLVLVTPTDGASIVGGVRVSGETDPHLIINVNGYQIQSDEHGKFEDIIALQSGFYRMEIQVENRFGRTAKLTRSIVVE